MNFKDTNNRKLGSLSDSHLASIRLQPRAKTKERRIRPIPIYVDRDLLLNRLSLHYHRKTPAKSLLELYHNQRCY